MEKSLMDFIKPVLSRNLYNIRGWRTKRHILVIESDDWGAVRMPSLHTYDYLVAHGVKLGKYGYEKVDTIASRDDLARLFDVCERHKDINGNPVIITANCVVANPDFERIISNDYNKYYYEPICDTMSRYYPNSSPFSYWKEGIDRGVFYPQFHGREHVNVPMWMHSLKEDAGHARLACEKGVYSILVDKSFDYRIKNTAAFKAVNSTEKALVLESIKDGVELFHQLFGYYSESMIAPSYCWDEDIESLTKNLGVKYIQGLHSHYENGKNRVISIGQPNNYGQRYLVRNAHFEYSQNRSINWNAIVLKDIEAAFRWHKPATLSVHRLNFIGSLEPNNRDTNLILFDELLSEIMRRWPDVEFLSTPQLGHLIESME